MDGLQIYAIKLRSAISNIRTCGNVSGPELCIIATEKIPQSMLVKYFESNGNGSTDILTSSNSGF